MKIKILLIILILGIAFSVTKAQVLINLLALPPYDNKTENFWNVTLVNGTSATYMAVLKISIIDNTNRKVMDSKSSSFSLKPGATYVNSGITGKIEITEGDSRYKSTVKNGILPSGNYAVYYTLENQSSDTNKILATSTQEREVINLTNIQLISPNDNEKITDELNGQVINFNWLPSATPNNTKVIRYTINIVEMYGRQSKIDAIQNNPSLIQMSNLIMPVYLHTADKRKFVSGRNYAWQVYETIDSIILAKSEVYEFSYQKNSTGKDSVGNTKTGYIDKEGTDYIGNTKERSASILFRKIKPFEFSLSSKLYGENSNRIANGSGVEQTYASWELTPTFTFYGIPFTSSIFLSSLNGASINGIDNINFNLDLQTLNDKISQMTSEQATIPDYMKFFGLFNKLNFGTTYPDYTPFTISGVSLKGMDFEINPGQFFLASSLFSNQKAENNIQFRRNIYSGRIGYGKKDKNHLFLTALYGRDNENSITINPPDPTLTAKENFITGIEGKLLLFKEKLELNGEITSSTYTRDVTDPLTANSTIPFFAKILMNQTVSTANYIAYTFRSKFSNDKSKTDLEAGIKMIGPGYSSLGVPYIGNDKLEIDGKINQKFLSNKLSLSASAKWNRDNLDNTLFATTKTTVLNFTMNYSPEKLPYFVVSFAPYFQKNDAVNPNFIVDNKFYQMTFVSGYTKMFKSGTSLTSTMSYALSKMTTFLNSNDFTNHNVTLSEAMSFKFPLTLSGSFSGYFGYTGLYTRILSGDFNAVYTSYEIWTNTLGANLSFEQNTNRKIGIYFRSGLTLSSYLQFDLNAEQNLYKDWINSANDYKEFILRGTVTTTF
jgi:hypothetical protein